MLRFEDGQHERELAVHRFVGERTSVPIAEIVFFDPTNNNPLGCPFVIQNRLPGRNLNEAYGSLTHEQRRKVVQEFGKILLALRAVKNDTAGVVKATTQDDGQRIYNVGRFGIAPDRTEGPIDGVQSNDHTVLNMLLTQYKLWLTYSLQRDSADVLSKDYYAQLSKIAREMDQSGLFEDQSFYLTHLDLEPRNVLVEMKDDIEASISGVLDWDSAVFAPIFASCRTPSWIWLWVDDEDEDERRANDVPEDPQLRELKQIFDETMGPAYTKYAYRPEYRMARFLFHVAKDGLRSSWIIQEAECIFKEWAEFTGNVDSPDAFIGCVALAFEKTVIEDEKDDHTDGESNFDYLEAPQGDAVSHHGKAAIDDAEGYPPDHQSNSARVEGLPKDIVSHYADDTDAANVSAENRP